MSTLVADEAVTSATIYERFRGLIASGFLGAGERLPTVRQTASDFGVSNGTAARAFRQLETEGYVVTRTGAGTTVRRDASPLPAVVVKKLREVAEAAERTGASRDDVVAALHAIWQAGGR